MLLVRTQTTPFTTKFLAWLRVLKLNGLLVLYSARCSKYPFTNRQSALRISLWRGYVGSAYHVWSDHVRCGNVRCWLLCLDATNSASSVLVSADAELIVYGATEPDATVTIGGRPIKLNPDGTFRFQMSFQDGLIDYPIMAVAADGEQTRFT